MARLDLDLLCGELEAPVPSAAGGSAAAAAGAIAASLLIMVGRGSPEWADGPAAAREAAALRDRLLALGGEDVEAVAAVLAASSRKPPSGPSDRVPLAQALIRASEVPLEIAECAADVAALADSAAQRGKRPMWPDAEAALTLATAAAQVALSIVRGNLAAPGLPQQELERLSEAARVTTERLDATCRPFAPAG